VCLIVFKDRLSNNYNDGVSVNLKMNPRQQIQKQCVLSVNEITGSRSFGGDDLIIYKFAMRRLADCYI